MVTILGKKIKLILLLFFTFSSILYSNQNIQSSFQSISDAPSHLVPMPECCFIFCVDLSFSTINFNNFKGVKEFKKTTRTIVNNLDDYDHFILIGFTDHANIIFETNEIRDLNADSIITKLQSHQLTLTKSSLRKTNFVNLSRYLTSDSLLKKISRINKERTVFFLYSDGIPDPTGEFGNIKSDFEDKYNYPNIIEDFEEKFRRNLPIKQLTELDYYARFILFNVNTLYEEYKVQNILTNKIKEYWFERNPNYRFKICGDKNKELDSILKWLRKKIVIEQVSGKIENKFEKLKQITVYFATRSNFEKYELSQLANGLYLKIDNENKLSNNIYNDGFDPQIILNSGHIENKRKYDLFANYNDYFPINIKFLNQIYSKSTNGVAKTSPWIICFNIICDIYEKEQIEHFFGTTYIPVLINVSSIELLLKNYSPFTNLFKNELNDKISVKYQHYNINELEANKHSFSFFLKPLFSHDAIYKNIFVNSEKYISREEIIELNVRNYGHDILESFCQAEQFNFCLTPFIDSPYTIANNQNISLKVEKTILGIKLDELNLPDNLLVFYRPTFALWILKVLFLSVSIYLFSVRIFLPEQIFIKQNISTEDRSWQETKFVKKIPFINKFKYQNEKIWYVLILITGITICLDFVEILPFRNFDNAKDFLDFAAISNNYTFFISIGILYWSFVRTLILKSKSKIMLMISNNYFIRLMFDSLLWIMPKMITILISLYFQNYLFIIFLVFLGTFIIIYFQKKFNKILLKLK